MKRKWICLIVAGVVCAAVIAAAVWFAGGGGKDPSQDGAPDNTPQDDEPTVPVQNLEGYASENLAKLLGEDNLEVLISAGVIAGDLTAVPVTPDPSESGEGDGKVQMEKVQTFGDHYVVITLSALLKTVDTSDIKLNKYSDNWYSLSPKTSSMTVEDAAYTVNGQGKTVLIYKTGEAIDGIRVVPDYSSKVLASPESEIWTADNYMSWQMDNGGWDKGVDEQAVRAWDGTEAKNQFSGWKAKDGSPIGTIDNEATYTQIRQIALAYRLTGEEKYRDSVLRGLDFIFDLQYESGGFAQVYPRRGGYSDYVTFNDNAMINVLIMLEDIRDKAYPFDTDLFPEEYLSKAAESIDKAVDYILKAQITSQGRLTAWCAQHDPVTYEPRGARAYELPSISGSESVAVVKFLIHQKNQTPEIQNAIECALQWFRDSEVKGLSFDKNDPDGKYFIEDPGSSLWYRFYEIDTNRAIFCDRDGIKKYDITEIGEERRTGYAWSGNWPKKLLQIYDDYGFYENLIEVSVVGTNSAASDGSTLPIYTEKAAEDHIG